MKDTKVANTVQMFDLGKLLLSQGVNDLVADNGEFARHVLGCLWRHAKGDWGDLCEGDKRENELAVREGLRILSAYESWEFPKLWIITEADRSVTTVLFPDEY